MMNMLHNVPCPTCGVATAFPCRRTKAPRADGVHVARKNAWLAEYDRRSEDCAAGRIANWIEDASTGPSQRASAGRALAAEIRAGKWRKGEP